MDLSRLLSRAGRGTPTGIDRVELAYAEHLIRGGKPYCFTALTASGRLGLLQGRAGVKFVATIGAAWRGTGDAKAYDARARQIARQARLTLLAGGERPLVNQLRDATGDATYLLVSHHHLERRGVIARLKERTAARFVCLVHDLIPMEFPEYAKPGQAEHHRKRIETAAELADAFIVNSSLTRDQLQPHLDQIASAAPVLVAPFGADLPRPYPDEPAALTRPYFVYVSTIEARKNHLLLLNIWRQMSAELGPSAPLLVLIGQRGWETENVIDMLERCPGLRETVIEYNQLPDREMVRLLRGAQAMLLPSFAEGFGFPLIEALQFGVPALCSDIPALRETGMGVPEFFDPIDGIGWRSAILDYTAPQSPRRAAQLERLSRWHPPRWEQHFTMVDRLLAEIAETGLVQDAPGSRALM
ncbi:MAG: glycosyltransferase family 4 protein [Alphaproteobacteria bacterium]|nr:glycosyltransferase family 4 protein [Alphaproteobacteria bacterium]